MKTTTFALAAATLGMIATPTIAGQQAHNPKNPEDVQASDAQRGDKTGSSKGKVEAEWKVEEGEAASTSGLSQNGTTVPTANTVQAPKSEERALIVPAVQQARSPGRSSRKMTQNGTTVSTASEVQAPKSEGRAQAAKAKKHVEWSRVHNSASNSAPNSQSGKMTQNGTTVPTASEVRAPRAESRSAAGTDKHDKWISLDSVNNTRNRRKMSQNGTTVPTASEVQAPRSERSRRKMTQNGTTVSTASEVQASSAQRGRNPR